MSENRFDQAVFKVLQLTHTGQLTWEHQPVPPAWPERDNVPLFFKARYEGRTLGLFQRSIRLPESIKQLYRLSGGTPDTLISTAVLALLAENDEVLYEFPASKQVRDLFDVVRYRAAGVEDFLDRLLNAEVTNEKE